MSRRRIKKLAQNTIHTLEDEKKSFNNNEIDVLNETIKTLQGDLEILRIQNSNYLHKIQRKDDILYKLTNEKKEYENMIRQLVLDFDSTIKHTSDIKISNINLKKIIEDYKRDNAILLNKYNSLKKQLSYRIGSYIVENRKKPFNIINHSKEFFNIYKNYLKESGEIKNHVNEKKILNKYNYLRNDNIVFYYANVILPLKRNAYNIFFEDLSKIIALKFDTFLAVPTSRVLIGFDFEIIEGEGLFSFIFPNNEVLNKKMVKGDRFSCNIEIENNKSYKFLEVLRSYGCKASLKINKGKGVPGIIKLYDDLNKLNLSIQNNIVIDGDKKDNLTYDLPANYRKNILWNANEIALNYNYSCAFDYIEKYANDYQKNATYILEANFNHGNENAWLKSINKYLNGFGLASISLIKGSESRFYRIKCNEELKKPIANKKISVIMPAYNAEKTIALAIDSILNQTWSNIELIVVDDCSTDNTWDVVNGINDPRLIKMRNEFNVGAYVSKNLALKHVTGDYVTGHDSDDWAHPQRLENHIKKVLLTNGKVKASITKMLRLDENGFFNFFAKEGPFCEDGVTRIASITCLFETEFLKNILGGWDCARFGADSEIIARAKIYLGEEGFKNYNELAMICLDAEGSLTNDVIHGVSKVHGISPTRKVYKNSWQMWHANLKPNNVYLPFPHIDRYFSIPEANMVDMEKLKMMMYS